MLKGAMSINFLHIFFLLTKISVKGRCDLFSDLATALPIVNLETSKKKS